MGFNSVYRCLQEIFPQVDARLLRAVAIEHPKDADLAAGIVLTEVIPLISQRLPLATPPLYKDPNDPIMVEVESEKEGNGLRHRCLVEGVDAGPSSTPHSISTKVIKTTDCSSGPDLNVALFESTLSNASNFNDGTNKFLGVNENNELNIFGNAEDNFTVAGSNKIAQETSNEFWQEASENFDHGQVHVDVDGENLISSGIYQEMEVEPEQTYPNKEAASANNYEQTYPNKEAASANNNGNTSGNHLNEPWVDFVGPSGDDFDVIIRDKIHSSEKCETALIDVESSAAEALCHVQGDVPNAKERSLEAQIDSGSSVAVGENLERGCSFLKQDFCISERGNVEDEIGEKNAVLNAKECSLQSELDYKPFLAVSENLEGGSFFKQDFCPSEMGDVEDEIGENNVGSQSGQVCRIDMLEEIIDEAKTSKKTLFSSMESLINLMREVELQENAAEQAKIEASEGGSNILVRVEEFKTMLAHVKEANDMHAGEVYGEKAILATELKELQSRLHSLSDERDESLAILDEMCQILETRLAAAEELMKAAEHEKLEKEDSARRALVEQEVMMEKVVKESTRLQQEAEENSKLREFLMDRGRVVDMLQGEISVICEDIRLLKEKFDANIPLSKSFTSSQTSCILASSGSSHKCLASVAGSVHSDSSETRKIIAAASIRSLSSESGHKEESARADDKALFDDGWDIFEKDAELNS